MDGKGALVVYIVGMILIIAYFSIYGFSHSISVRWAQYIGIAFTSYCLLDEIVSL